MSSIITRPFTNNDNYTKSDDTKIGAVGGNGTLLLIDNPDQTFSEDFADDTGFIYDSITAEFTSGLVQQLDITPTSSVLGAKFNLSTSANWNKSGSGLAPVLTGAPIIVANTLECIGTEGVGINIPNLEPSGEIRTIYKPNYSGIPIDNIGIIGMLQSVGGQENRIAIRHSATSGAIIIILTHQISQSIYITTPIGASWLPVSGREYELVLNWNLADRKIRLFIDGVLINTLITPVAWEFVTAPATISVGSLSGIAGATSADAYYKETIFYNSVIHTTSYVKGYTVPSTIYTESKVDLPAFNYACCGSIQAFTNLSATIQNNVKVLLNGYYYNGADWILSDGSYAQANTIAAAAAAIASLPVSDSMIVSAILGASNTQSNISLLTLTYTGQIYPIDNPWIMFNVTTTGSEILDFIASISISGSDAVRFAIEVDGYDYYITGSTLTASDGYAKTNTAAELLAEKELLITERSDFRYKVYLHSEDGLTTPTIDYFSFAYDAALPDVYPTLIDVNGFFYKGHTKNTERLKYRPYQSGFINEGITYVYAWVNFDSTLDANGYGSQYIPKNPAGTKWEIKLGKESAIFTLESVDGTFVDFADLAVTFLGVE